MIPCPYCEGAMTCRTREWLKTGEMVRRFRCKCCLRWRNAYSIDDGKTYKWDNPQLGRSRRGRVGEYVFV